MEGEGEGRRLGLRVMGEDGGVWVKERGVIGERGEKGNISAI